MEKGTHVSPDHSLSQSAAVKVHSIFESKSMPPFLKRFLSVLLSYRFLVKPIFGKILLLFYRFQVKPKIGKNLHGSDYNELPKELTTDIFPSRFTHFRSYQFWVIL